MSEITIDTDAVVDAVVAKLDLSDTTMVVHEAVQREVRRLVKAEIKDSLRETVRAAVADEMPAFTEALKEHVVKEMKVRQRRFEAKLARVTDGD
jgi:oligoribonuclease NrnB/cAMP/cGMP phosphodiesterase (DHH superfamily)